MTGFVCTECRTHGPRVHPKEHSSLECVYNSEYDPDAPKMSVAEAIDTIDKSMEHSIDRLAVRAYELKNRKFTPLKPWCFVRVLPKEQVQNGIILPATEQNKTIHEGIILATWKPFYEVRNHSNQENGYSTTIHRASTFKPGDHVVFPHWAGLPIAGYSDKHYRVIKEEGWKETQDGGIFGGVEYAAKNTSPIEVLRQMLQPYCGGINADRVIEEIEQRFLLVDREATSVTLSGR